MGSDSINALRLGWPLGKERVHRRASASRASAQAERRRGFDGILRFAQNDSAVAPAGGADRRPYVTPPSFLFAEVSGIMRAWLNGRSPSSSRTLCAATWSGPSSSAVSRLA